MYGETEEELMENAETWYKFMVIRKSLSKKK